MRSARAEAIVRATSQRTEVSVSVVMGESRRARPALARKIAIYIIRDDLGWTLTEIADYFHRDHSTIQQSIKGTRALLRVDAEIGELVSDIRADARQLVRPPGTTARTPVGLASWNLPAPRGIK